MSKQITIRIPEDLTARLEKLVATGRFETKADAIRAAIQSLLERERTLEIGRRIAEGYRRTPQSDEEEEVAMAAAIRSIHEEPW